MTRLSHLGCVLLAAGALAGCAHTGPQKAAGSPKNFQARRLEDSGLKLFMERNLGHDLETWPLPSWDFPALTLAACYFNPAAKAVREQWQAAETEAATAAGQPRSRRLGAHNLTPGALITIAPDNVSGAAPDFSAAAPQLGPGAMSNSSKTARTVIQAQYRARLLRLRAAMVLWQIRASLRTNLVNYVAAQRRQELWTEMEAVQMELVQAARGRSPPDKAPPIELSLLQIQLAQTRLQLIVALEEKWGFREQLADSLGLPPRALLQATVTNDLSRAPGHAPGARELRRLALRSRSDVLRAVIECTAAEADLRLALGRSGADVVFPPACRWDALRNRWTIDLTLNPFLNAHRAIAKAQAHRTEAAARLLNLQAEVLDELENRAGLYYSLAEDAAVIDRLTASIRRRHDTAEALFKAGAGSRAELLMIQLQLLPAELAQLDAQEKHQEALGSLEDAVQQPAEAF